MKYAVNYSEVLLQLLEEEKVDIDYIKAGAFGKAWTELERCYQKKPLLLHGFGWFERTGMILNGKEDFQSMNQWIHTYGSPHIGLHLMAYEKDRTSRSIFKQMVETVTAFKNHLSVPLLLENIDYSPYYQGDTTLKETVDPGFISQVIEATDSGFLLDLAHAKVSAYHLGMDFKTYLDRLPLERIREIHLSGTGFDKTRGYRDTHGVLEEVDYDWLNYVLLRANPLVITLEYGFPGRQPDKKTKPDEIIKQLARLRHSMVDS